MEAKYLTYLSNSDRDTIEFGKRIASFLKERDVLALIGELGSGKTWFTKGIALGLGIPSDRVVTSPSFALVNEYAGTFPLYHMDVYRLQNLSDFLNAGLEEYLYTDGIIVMEWADRWPEILPEYSLTAAFEIIDDHRREITLSGHHPRAVEIVEQVEREKKRE